MRERLAADPPDALGAGEAAASHLLRHPRWSSVERVRLFAGLRDEIDTRPIFEVAASEGRRVSFPRCVGDELEFRWVPGWGALERGRFGALEPPASEARGSGIDELASHFEPRRGSGAESSAAVLWLVPGLAFDSRGARLGRGGGFYDRALARCAALREADGAAQRPGRLVVVGLAFAAQRVDEVPSESHDQRVDALLCEDGWHWTAPKAERAPTTGEA